MADNNDPGGCASCLGLILSLLILGSLYVLIHFIKWAWEN